MNILCARALALGAAQSSRVIGSQTVREAIAGLDYLRAGRGKSGPSGIFRGIFSARSLRILFFILSFALFLFSLAATASFLFRR
jgi:hypothetical protein